MKLVEDLKSSLFDNTVDVALDYSELWLDNITAGVFGSGVLKQIPVVKTLCSVIETGAAVHEKNLLRETLIFIATFNAKTIDPKKLAKYKLKIKEKPRYVRKELERVLLILNKIIDDGKAEILARLYRNYIEEQMTWDDFCELTDITERMFLTDIRTLVKSYESDGIDVGEVEGYHLDRLISLGLLENSLRLGGNIIISGGDASGEEEEKKDVNITELGKLYCRCGILG